MAPDLAVAEAMYQHVLGVGDPSDHLLEHGELPQGWAAEYRRLLGIAEVEWLPQPNWPRRLVAAMHYALLYLDVRYSAWRSFSGGAKRDENTERELASVRASTRLFFAQSFPEGADPDGLSARPG